MLIRRAGYALLVLGALVGCESSIRPLRPLEHVEVPVAAPATDAAATEASTAPSTQPGPMVATTVDPNQTARFIYQASYDNIWQQAMNLFNQMGFTLDEQDYRLGVLTTKPLASSQIIEFWKPQHVNLKDSMENTLHSQRRTLRLTISLVPGKPDFYQLAIQVLVERESNPSEQLAGPMFVEGSGFGRNRLSLQSDYASPTTQAARWIVIGHDPDMERKLLDQLFSRL